MKKYQLIASGTFDLLHEGHKSFLKKALEISDEVVVCITSNSYVKSFKNPKDIEDFEIRKRNVIEFLESIGKRKKAIIIPIDDIYGPLLTNQINPQGIAVTPENEKNGVLINSERAKKGLPRLDIKVIPMDLAEDGKEISSTRIRSGEINREGRLYIRKSWLKNSLTLPQNLRSTLQRPYGKVLSSIPSDLDASKIITIGDVTTQKFNKKKAGQFLSIVDFQVKRQKMFNKLSELGFEKNIEMIAEENLPGSITPKLFAAVQKAFKSSVRKVILVNGEEDLAVLPVLLVAPLGFTIFYGQPNEGLVEVLVTEENKGKAFNLVNKFQLS